MLLVSGRIFADALKRNVTGIAFAGLGLVLMTDALTLDDIAAQGETLTRFLRLALPFASSEQLNGLGFIGYASQRLAFASSYFCVTTPQAGSQNLIFVGVGYLTQRELCRLGLLITLFFLTVFLVLGTAWILQVTR